MATKRKLMLAGTLAVLAACQRTYDTNAGLSVSTRASLGGATATSTGLDLGNGIELTRVRMAVRRVHVEGGDAMGSGCAASPGGAAPARSAADHGGPGGDDPGMDPSHDGSTEREECEISVGPFDVDLAGSALSGSVAFAFHAPIADGTYDEIAIVVQTVPAEQAGADPVLQALAAAHASIVVDGFIQEPGTTTRTAFTFSTPMEVKQKREGTIRIGEGANVTLDFDPSGWFGGTGGARLDPRLASNRGAIEAAIRASIRLEKDDDADGEDDGR